MKYAVISSDANTDYLFYLPLTCFSWARIGYVPDLYLVNVPEDKRELLRKYSFGANINWIDWTIKGAKDSTIAQLVRLWAPQMHDWDDTVILGDADMLIVKDIFKSSDDQLASYGFDLTGRSEIPMCYVKGLVGRWLDLMKYDGGSLEDLIGDFKAKAVSEKWEDYWSTDQQLLTARAKEYGFDKINFIDRGHGSHGLPTGRWDRHDWSKVPDDIIDVHMLRSPLHEERWPLVKDMVKRLWPQDNWEWLEEYKKEFEAI